MRQLATEKKPPPKATAVAVAECSDSDVPSRPSRRALHRHAVKKFNERRKNEERKRAAEVRDEKLLHLDRNAEGDNADNTNGDSNNDTSHTGKTTTRKDVLGKSVLLCKWDFDFFFPIMLSESLPTRSGAEAEVAAAAEVADADSFAAAESALVVPLSSSVISPAATVTENHHHKDLLHDEVKQSVVLLNDGNPRPLKGSLPINAMMQSSIAKSIHVRHVEGVPPLPMTAPLQPGTDLDMPTWNYLLPDTTYNVHQHAPGFERDDNAAKRSMLTCALQEWRNGDDNVFVLSTGEALRSVFEATYIDEKPLTLEVRRIGPTLIVDSLSEQKFRTRVRDLRGKALLGKALYRILDESTGPRGASDIGTSTSTGGSDFAAHPSEKGIVTLPVHRIGSVAVSREAQLLSGYSHIFRWEIGTMNVLVGIDTPIVLDRRNNMEYVLELRDTSVNMTPQELQRDILRCWFNATLANVPEVGIYVHNDGIIQRYEVTKAQEMLGLMEGRMATAAMNFTTNVLQGLVSECRKDGTTYAVIRNYESGALEIYECSSDERLEKFLPEDGADVDEDQSGSNAKKHSVEEEEKERRRRAEESERLNWGLATMCYRMGMRLKDSEEKAPDALSLLLRSFAVHFQQRSRIEEACHHVCDISKSLPGLIGRLINNRKAALEDQGGIVQLPEIYREAFQMCGRFELRLQEAVCDEDLRLATRYSFLQCLLPCSAALCVCIARTMERFCVVRSVYLLLRKESGSSSSSNKRIHNLVAKNLLQVVVEGLLRLEQMNHMLKSDTTLTQCTQVSTGAEEKALIDTKTEIIDVALLEATLWELYADVVLLVLSDRTPFTADTLVELSRLIKSREEQRHTAVTGGDSTLTWMSAITHDVVSLSFTALRFITKAGLQSKRLMSKAAQVYYHVGHNYLLTDRYTKALDSLHRAESLFKAMQQGPPDSVFGESCIATATITIKDVSLSLGEVFVRMAQLKSRPAPVEVRLGAHQPLAMGEMQCFSAEEELFYRQAVDHFAQCEANDRLAVTLRAYALRQIACMVCGGQQADAAKGRHIYSMLRTVGELLVFDAALEWEVLRLCTCAPPHAALQRSAEEIMTKWTGSTVLGVVNPPPELAASVHPLECTLQLALVSVVLLQVKKKLKMHQALGLVREGVAFVMVALADLDFACSGGPVNLLARAVACWKMRCPHEWVYQMARMICLRATQAILRHLPGDKGSAARLLLQRLMNLAEKEVTDVNEKNGKSEELCKETTTKVDACGNNCYFLQLAESLLVLLEDVAKW